jgi:ZipA-like protein with FtsZ-binding domain
MPRGEALGLGNMSDLQIALTVVGALVVACVVAYNRIQENQYRRRAQASFGGERGDALSDPLNGNRQDRIEPSLTSAPAEAVEPVGPVEVRAGRVEPGGVPSVARSEREESSPIDYPVLIRSRDSLQRAALQQLLEALDGLGRRAQVLAESPEGHWIRLANAPEGVSCIRVALQLVDRRGHAAEDDLAALLGLLRQWARGVGATVEAPELKPYLEVAKDLDRFCADVDVVVGLNVVPASGKPFSGAKLHGCAKAAGFRLENGTFKLEDANGNRLFTLESQRGEPFDLDRLEAAVVSGVTLLLDVPRLEHGVQAFDQMIHAGTRLAADLGGTLVDDNDAPVTEAGLDQIRAQLRGIYAAMEAKGIRAGSRVALRLFS